MNVHFKLIFGVILLFFSYTSFSQTNYNYSKLTAEKLGRGVVAIRSNPNEVTLSWRYLSSDNIRTSFNIYKNTCGNHKQREERYRKGFILRCRKRVY